MYRELFEMVEEDDYTWPELEDYFGRSRKVLGAAFHRHKKLDLLHKVQIATYGVVGHANIVSVVQNRVDPTTRDRDRDYATGHFQRKEG